MDNLKKWKALSKRRQLELLLKLSKSILSSQLTDQSGLSELAEKIAPYKDHPDNDLERLFLLHNNLLKNPSLKKLFDFNVFLERLCNIDSVETDFLIRMEDQLEPVAHSPNPLYLVLENIRSAFNVGTILRTADCLGATEVLLVGYTPTPDTLAVRKTALGAEEKIKWQSFEKIEDAFSYLDKKEVPIVALETSSASQSLFNYQFASSVAFVLGNERFGLSHEALTHAEFTMTIPTFGYKNSLNVSHAFAISGYEAVRQWSSKPGRNQQHRNQS